VSLYWAFFKVKNSSGSPIVIMLPTTSASATDANGTMVYNQAVEVLTATDGTKEVPAGATKTFVLNQTYVNPSTKKTAYATIYDLLPSTADWYAPVANIGVMQSFATPPSYPGQTVTAASAAAFKNAATFVQTVSAYPTSALATQYQQAISQAQGNASGQANGSGSSSGAVAQSISSTVNNFFKGTKSFQNVTLEAVVAVQSYYGTFPFAWAEYAAGPITYYLYSSSGSATSFAGTITLTRPAAVNVALASGGYTCTFTPAADGADTTTVKVNSAAAKSLTYAGGLFVDNAASDIPQIAVKGTFQIKSLFTAKPADTQVITVLTGTVNGKTCIGFDSAQLSSDPSSSFWDTLFHPKNSAQVFQSIMEIGGALMLIVFAGQSLYGIYKWARGLAAGKQPTTRELLDEQMTKLQESQKATLEDLVKKLTAGKEAPPASAESALDAVKEQSGIIADNQSAIKLQNGLEAQAQSLQEVAEFAPEMSGEQLQALESVGSQVQDSMSALTEASPKNLGPVVAEQGPNLQDISGQFADLQSQVGSVVSESAKAAIAQNSELVEKASTESSDIQANEEGIGEDVAPEAEPIIPEL
jgi:hypothetical protein